MRKEFLEHLAPLIDEELVVIWHDRAIGAGGLGGGD
jgi:hypothetical protein